MIELSIMSRLTTASPSPFTRDGAVEFQGHKRDLDCFFYACNFAHSLPLKKQPSGFWVRWKVTERGKTHTHVFICITKSLS